MYFAQIKQKQIKKHATNYTDQQLSINFVFLKMAQTFFISIMQIHKIVPFLNLYT